MNEAMRELIRESVLDIERFVGATFTAGRKGKSTGWKSASIRPVLLKRGRTLKFSFFDGTKDVTKNFAIEDASEELDRLIGLPLSSISIERTDRAFHLQITAKGKAILHEDKVRKIEPDLAHNRTKETILNVDRDAGFLQAIGVVGRDGNVLPSRQAKFRQINEFLKLFEHTRMTEGFDGQPINIVDFGCGSAHLTFGIHYYINHVLGRAAHTTGVDLKEDLLHGHRETVESLGWTEMHFVVGQIADVPIDTKPDIVLALHACDTATDDALLRAIEADAAVILAAPCCHHDLQVRLGAVSRPDVMKPVLAEGILRERVGDILTDSFRALILRILGYRTDVIEFVSSEHTDKNLMIRAVRREAPASNKKARKEYAELKAFWGVTPYLEEALGSRFPA